MDAVSSREVKDINVQHTCETRCAPTSCRACRAELAAYQYAADRARWGATPEHVKQQVLAGTCSEIG